MPTTQVAADIFAKARNHERAEQLRWARDNDFLPYFRPLDGKIGPTVQMEGKERIMLGSNCYLGLTGEPRVIEAAERALRQFGTGLTGSRLLNGTTTLHEELEAEIADWLGIEDVIVFSTGYQANLGGISSVIGPGDTVICDRYDHASIFDACTFANARLLRFAHADMSELEQCLGEARQGEGGVLVAVDGIYSMEGDICQLDQVAELCRSYEARLMVDEAHAVGVLGEAGRGTTDLFAVDEAVDIRMGTFSKSLASCGGFIGAPAEVAEYMRYVSCRPFIFTAAAVPAALGAALAAIRICRSEEGGQLAAQVADNARYLQAGFAEIGLTVLSGPIELADGSTAVSPIVPVLVGDDVQTVLLWKALYERGIYTNAAVYPSTPRNGALIRVSAMATHERAQLDRAIETFAELKSEFPDLLSASASA